MKCETSSKYKYRYQLLWILTIHCIPYRHLENSTFHFTLNISIYWTWEYFETHWAFVIFPPYSNKRKSYLSPIKHSESPNFTLLSSKHWKSSHRCKSYVFKGLRFNWALCSFKGNTLNVCPEKCFFSTYMQKRQIYFFLGRLKDLLLLSVELIRSQHLPVFASICATDWI